MDSPALIWFRRDLRLADLPTLLTARAEGSRALAVFVLDDTLVRPSGAPRTAFLAGCLRALDDALGGRLLVVAGDPVEEIGRIAAHTGSSSVHVSADFGPYGAARDEAVDDALGPAISLVRTGSPYAVSPGLLRTQAGGHYRVFGPYRRAWLERGWHSPARTGPDTLDWVDPATVPGRITVDSAARRLGADQNTVPLPEAGEAAALRRWDSFLSEHLDSYDDQRNRPDLEATTRLSPYLKFGCIHPRTLLHDIAGLTGAGAATLRTELAWRDFYADVLHHRPDTARGNYNPAFDAMQYDAGAEAEAAFAAWRTGQTGFPIVDAGMRQLAEQGWMHNRVRMITASFLTKDLHLPWWWGARHFMGQLIDGDLASNQHGWQWTAGCGTDAAPYFRVFNPTTQGERFDPSGDYVRRWVPELRGLRGKAAHQPWKHDVVGYPEPIVDHRREREVALDRYRRL